MYSSYARYLKAKKLQIISGTESLGETDKHYLDFGNKFKEQFLNQQESRSIRQSFETAWDLVELLPDIEKAKIPENFKSSQ